MKPNNDHILVPDEDPFGAQGGVVVFFGGSANKLTPRAMGTFNPAGQSNSVLRP